MPNSTSIPTPSSPEVVNIPPFDGWRTSILLSVETLCLMAGTTEDEFLQIGARLQSFYQRSVDISQKANQLMEVVSGDRLQLLIRRLREVMGEMESYLADSGSRSDAGCATLEKTLQFLEDLSGPLEGFRKMNKALRMLSTSTKIESARLGEIGSGFVSLAMDVEKLSQQVNDRSSAILEHRQMVATMITSNLNSVHSSEIVMNNEVRGTLAGTAANLQELTSVNERCSSFGSMVSAVSADVTANISEVVSSQQAHDITRQKIEHVALALESLAKKQAGADAGNLDEESKRALIIETGDVCELQKAQLRFASDELYAAVCTIVENLRDVARKQNSLAQETMAVAGVADYGGSSFVDELKSGMLSITSVLNGCSATDHNMAITMQNVAGTIQQITVFVSDIEYIGSEIDLIALNAQVKAAHTGPEGAGLGVLAEAIKRLSDEAERQTAAISGTLTGIHTATVHLHAEAGADEAESVSHIASIEAELAGILQTLAGMNSELCTLLVDLGDRVQSLTDDLEQATAGIEVHERIKGIAADLLAELERIVAQARQIEPSSSEFRNNLRFMEERYTMDSERHVHEDVAGKRGVPVPQSIPAHIAGNRNNEYEFGENVDLF